MDALPQELMGSSAGDETSSVKSTTEFDVLLLMKQRLPQYVVNCFLAAGFDVPEVISAMDISANPGNSITQIESFIAKRYRGDPRYSHNPSLDFEFPPGHRMRICNFVREVKMMCGSITESHTVSRKRKYSGGRLAKKQELTCTDESDGENVSTVSNQIRRSMSAWVRKQTDQRLKTLQEKKHYSVLVTNVATEPCSLSVSVRCVGCNTCIHLQKKDSSSEATPYLISKWSRHVKKCVSCKHTGFKYPRIDHFLAGCPSESSDSVSHDLSESDGVHTDNNLSQPSGLPTVAKAVASSVLPQLDSLQSPITNALSDQLQSSLSAFDGLSETCNSQN